MKYRIVVAGTYRTTDSLKKLNMYKKMNGIYEWLEMNDMDSELAAVEFDYMNGKNLRLALRAVGYSVAVKKKYHQLTEAEKKEMVECSINGMKTIDLALKYKTSINMIRSIAGELRFSLKSKAFIKDTELQTEKSESKMSKIWNGLICTKDFMKPVMRVDELENKHDIN